MSGDRDVDELLEAQRLYYELRAPDYADVSRPSDRRSRGELASSTVRDAVGRFAPWGDVLEVACGSGAFTRDLVRHARTVTFLDTSPRMLELNRTTVGSPAVDYICADIFDWQPERTYDEVFFGFWLSHVPPARFDEFWNLVGSCLRPGGRAFFVDEDERGTDLEASRSDGRVPTAQRTLSDGRTFDIVKVFWNADELEQRLGAIEWHARVRPLGPTCYLGVASPAHPDSRREAP